MNRWTRFATSSALALGALTVLGACTRTPTYTAADGSIDVDIFDVGEPLAPHAALDSDGGAQPPAPSAVKP